MSDNKSFEVVFRDRKQKEWTPEEWKTEDKKDLKHEIFNDDGDLDLMFKAEVFDLLKYIIKYCKATHQHAFISPLLRICGLWDTFDAAEMFDAFCEKKSLVSGIKNRDPRLFSSSSKLLGSLGLGDANPILTDRAKLSIYVYLDRLVHYADQA